MILNGDCLDKLKTFPTNYFDAVVTDPPYGLAFMGKRWDYDVPSVEIWKEVLRVLKPGGHLLSFGGTRTYHRMVVNIEDAGFEIRDQLQWIYGQGFPKSHDISKAIDRQQGLRGQRLGEEIGPVKNEWGYKDREILPGDPSTEDAKRWQGWGSALKPANEPICMARKPLDGTLAENTLKWGCGGINVDAGRIEGIVPSTTQGQSSRQGEVYGTDQRDQRQFVGHVQGRFPSNVLLDEAAAEMLDEQSGMAKPKAGRKGKKGGNTGALGAFAGSTADAEGVWPEDPGGGASRFFYVAKASKSERNAGLEGMPSKVISVWGGDEDDLSEGKKSTIPRQNHHPTVKPLKLMEYLIKLITPPGGIVLDPFAGSGTTLVAAKRLGFDCVGIEREREYCEISEKRLEAV